MDTVQKSKHSPSIIYVYEEGSVFFFLLFYPRSIGLDAQQPIALVTIHYLRPIPGSFTFLLLFFNFHDNINDLRNRTLLRVF